MRKALLAVLMALVGLVVPTTAFTPPATASPSQHYSQPYFGDGNFPPGCVRERTKNPDYPCHHMVTGLNALDSPQVDVLVLVPVSPTAERDMRTMRQSVEMWEGGIDYLAEEMGLDWLAEGMDFHVTVHAVDPLGEGGEFTTYPIVDPEIVIVAANPGPLRAAGADPVWLASGPAYSPGKLLPVNPVQPDMVPCHGLANPFDFEQWENLPGFDDHHGGRSGTYVEDCGGSGGNICFAVNGPADPAPDVIDALADLFDIVSHEVGHCLTVGHVGDAATTWARVPFHDIMSYGTTLPFGRHKCVSTLDVEGVAIRMSRYLDTNLDGVVDSADRLLANDQIGTYQPGDTPLEFEPVHVQHQNDHRYASATGSSYDCPQPDLGLVPGRRTDWTPAPVSTDEAVLTLTGPQHGAVSENGTFEVTGTVEHDRFFEGSGPTASHDDADDDAAMAATEILGLAVDVTDTHIDATIGVAELWEGTGAGNPVEYILYVDGTKIHSFISVTPTPGSDSPFRSTPAISWPNASTTWDWAADTVSFHIPRDSLARWGHTSPYEITSEAVLDHPGDHVLRRADDSAPDVGQPPLRVAARPAAGCGSECPAVVTGLVQVHVDGVLAGSEDVDTSSGPDTFAVSVDLTEGSHELRVDWVEDGEVIATESLTVTHNTDDDGDGVPNADDACPGFDDSTDQDGDATPDGCDPDVDGDGVANASDNCPERANADQANLDGDAKGDACDSDMDGDGHSNAKEKAHGTDPADPRSYPTTGGTGGNKAGPL